MAYGENERDCLEWNKEIKRAIVRYEMATKEGKIADKKDESLEILKLIDDKLWCNYDIDGINLSSEQIDIITHIEDTIAGKTKQQYYKPQSVWNEELAHALSEGELIEALDLMQVGKKFGFVKSIKCISENAEYLGKLNSFISKIKRTMDRNEAR